MRVNDLILCRISKHAIFGPRMTYPARVGIQKPPPNSICAHLLHAPAAIQEDSKHTLSEVNDLLVLLCVGRVGCVVGHGMLFRNRRNYESGMESGKGVAKRRKFRISPPNNEVLGKGEMLAKR